MKIAFFSSQPYDQSFFTQANERFNHDLAFFKPRLTPATATLADGFSAVCVFINDDLGKDTLEAISAGGTRLVALRCAGFNNVDLAAARQLGITVVRVPAYSPHAVAEHAVGLIMMLNRKLYRAYNRVRDDNFSLNGLLGFDVHGKTVGVIGTGKIGQCFAQIMQGFGCKVLAHDLQENPACLKLGIQYLPLSQLLPQCDILSLHCPLTSDTWHLFNTSTFKQLKPGAMLINTSRGGLINTTAALASLKSAQLGYLGIDVYEGEESLFFEDRSGELIRDDAFQLLQSFPNVVITAHQAFFTQEAMVNISTITLQNISDIEQHQTCTNSL